MAGARMAAAASNVSRKKIIFTIRSFIFSHPCGASCIAPADRTGGTGTHGRHEYTACDGIVTGRSTCRARTSTKTRTGGTRAPTGRRGSVSSGGIEDSDCTASTSRVRLCSFRRQPVAPAPAVSGHSTPPVARLVHADALPVVQRARVGGVLHPRPAPDVQVFRRHLVHRGGRVWNVRGASGGRSFIRCHGGDRGAGGCQHCQHNQGECQRFHGLSTLLTIPLPGS